MTFCGPASLTVTAQAGILFIRACQRRIACRLATPVFGVGLAVAALVLCVAQGPAVAQVNGGAGVLTEQSAIDAVDEPATPPSGTAPSANEASAPEEPKVKAQDLTGERPAPATVTSPGTGAGPAVVTAPAAPAAPALPDEVRVATWSGAYGEAQELAFFEPFMRESGTTITKSTHGVRGVTWPRRAERAGDATTSGEREIVSNWDVADVPAHAVAEACESGLLAQLPEGFLADAFTPEQVSDGALSRCGVANLVWSSVIVTDLKTTGGRAPATLADVFKPAAFRGRRALPQKPEYLLEAVLLADGVPPAQVYEILATETGVRRALETLEPLREQITWWRDASEAMVLLRDKDVAFAMAFNGRAFYSVATQPDRFAMLWDGQITSRDAWVVSAAAQNPKAALDFIAFAMEPDRLGRFATLFPYGPTRSDAIATVGAHPVLKVDMKPFLPTLPANAGSALAYDHAFWRERGDTARELFALWLKGPLPKPVPGPVRKVVQATPAQPSGDTAEDG